MLTIDDLLASYRAAAITQKEKGTYFERLCVAYLTHDPVQAQQYDSAMPWAEWAKAHGWNGKDIGIDLVAKLKDHDGYAAIQCKFYDPKHKIAKADIDSFLAASAKEPFQRRVVMDTTEVEWSDNAEATLLGQTIPVLRIGLNDMRASSIKWGVFASKNEVVLEPKKELRPHQKDALEAVQGGLAEHDRGKLIMACGTGKTFTSLKIAENIVGSDGLVLFLVPSLALMAQTVREWTTDTTTPLRSFAVCSDSQVGKRRVAKEDVAEISVLDLAFPATTDAAKLAAGVADPAAGKMTVVFATYQSIQVVSDAQKKHGLPRFNLIVCDEAHRTTGATLEGQEESNFVRVHRDDVIGGDKRIYMTATPRIFGDGAKSKADEMGIALAAMDDESLYGPTLFHRGFGWAVQEGLLSDYKVIVLAMDEGLVARSVQKRMAADNELQLDDATKIVGCYKALTKIDLTPDVGADTQPMRRALAFCRDIASSKLVRDEFTAVVDEFLDYDPVLERETEAPPREDQLQCEIQHVDGTYNAKTRGELLDWLKAEPEENACRILTNARCLSEGVDIPALDAIMFLHPRKSQIDVVQSVGRVMRRAPGKRMGYVILPVGVPSGVPPEQALADNERYRVVWQILNALRAHDERFEGTINQIDLGQDVSDRIQIIGVSGTAADSKELDAITAKVDKLPTKVAAKRSGIGRKGHDGGDDDIVIEGPDQPELPGFIVDEFARAIKAKIVKKCGNRDYWEDWAGNIAQIAQAHITRINGILAASDTPARHAFDTFLGELRDDLNAGISEEDAVEMLAQHIITRPVFEVLFEGHQFTEENPVSRAIQGVLGSLADANLEKENKDLEKFYASVQARASGITDPKAKQELIRQLYDKFFAVAFKRVKDKLGIVYTPVEIVDFILHSVNDVLQDEFGQTIGSPGVHIIDPFTGTGTFITRLLQSGLIRPEEMEHKFRHELHANEIVLLAYYIAAINIEAVYHGLQGGAYVPFEGICLTDTFQMYETDDLISHYMPDNSTRRRRQKATDIRVIVGNPPYSSGQNSANDHAANTAYPHLDDRLRDTYVARSKNPNKRALYDSYIRAIRWASDRIGDAGVVAYVTNAGWVEATAADGMRACLAEEYTDLFVFHLRGNQRTSGEQSRKEGGKIFGSGSRAPIAISIFVKNPEASEHGRIFFHDIGDYLDQKQKLEIISDFGSIGGMTKNEKWVRITPNDQNDWLNQRDNSFKPYIKIGDKRDKDGPTLFETYSRGIATARDAWVYNSSKNSLTHTVKASIDLFNFSQGQGLSVEDIQGFKWCENTIKDYRVGKKYTFNPERIVPATYRPFLKQWLYYDKALNWSAYRMPVIYPNRDATNRMIVIEGSWRQNGNLAMMCDNIHALMPDGGCQCFPLYVYDQQDDHLGSLFEGQTSGYRRRDAITNEGLKHFQDAYPGEAITKEDIFYYVYGLLHSEDYRRQFADNLSKELPRIPCVSTSKSFWHFVDAGRKLGDLHVHYETVEPYPVTLKQGDLRLADIPNPEAYFRVTKMNFGKKGKDKDRSTIVYNSNITLTNVPLEAYNYVVNGRSAIEWVMERQGVREDKDSGIVNDVNCYATETVGDPRYPFDLLCRVITVSLETMTIVRSLPKLDIMPFKVKEDADADAVAAE